MLAEHPRISVAYTSTQGVAFEAVILQGIPHREWEEIDVAHIKAATDKMCRQEVAVESLARPPAEFGLHEPVFPFAIVGECEGVESGRDVEGGLPTQAYLNSQIG